MPRGNDTVSCIKIIQVIIQIIYGYLTFIWP